MNNRVICPIVDMSNTFLSTTCLSLLDIAKEGSSF